MVVEFGPNPTWVAQSVHWCRPVPWGRRGAVPGAEKGRFGKKGVLSQITIFTVFGPPTGLAPGVELAPNWGQTWPRHTKGQTECAGATVGAPGPPLGTPENSYNSENYT